MANKTDVEIAQACEKKGIREIAASAGRAERLPRSGQEPKGMRGRGLHRRADGRHHDYAGPAEGAVGGENRRGDFRQS
jgi:hypothetical protein